MVEPAFWETVLIGRLGHPHKHLPLALLVHLRRQRWRIQWLTAHLRLKEQGGAAFKELPFSPGLSTECDRVRTGSHWLRGKEIPLCTHARMWGTSVRNQEESCSHLFILVLWLTGCGSLPEVHRETCNQCTFPL